MTENNEISISKKQKLSPDQIFTIYTECSIPGAPVKTILDRNGLKPWHLIAIRKKIKEAALRELSNPSKPGKKRAIVPFENVQQLEKELSQTKDALAAVGHELALLKKKDELGLKGPLKGHFSEVVRKTVVEAIETAIKTGFKQKQACRIFDIVVRKYRRWSNPKPKKQRTAWNTLLPQEQTAIKEAAYIPELIGKPMSHIFVYGHKYNAFHVSMTSIYRYLKPEGLVKPFTVRKKTSHHVSAKDLLDSGLSLLTYDGTSFRTETGLTVWAIPVLILPFRFLLNVGTAINGVTGDNLTKAVEEGLLKLPENILNNIVGFSDRGSAMKSWKFKNFMETKTGIPLFYGRPNTPDDEPWIEALNGTMKYHRDAPKIYPTVDDVIDWTTRFPAIYNNDPHSSLKYVTPTEALNGQMEVILKQRMENLILAKKKRLEAFHASMIQVVNC